MFGQRFDIFQPGVHRLLQIPRWLESAQSALLRVDAVATKAGGACAEIFFQSVNISGSWVEEQTSGPLQFHAGASTSGGNSTGWMRVGPVLDLKVVWGHTDTGIEYLNLFTRYLSRVMLPIGGLLGEDDHTRASAPEPSCKHKVALYKQALADLSVVPDLH